MADFGTTRQFQFNGSSFDAGAGQFTYGSVSDTAFSDTVFDDDNSSSMTAGDFYVGDFFPYAGFTITINGNPYAVFSSDFSPGIYFIPHNGEITPADLPAQPIPVTVADPAVVWNCFLTGTRIDTPSGEVAIEALQPGDRILTADGREALVRWVWRQAVSNRFGPADRLLPVRIRAGALGEGLPRRDLLLTADHALMLEGLLVNAGVLVNGAGIDWVPLSELGEGYAVWHVECDDHEVILAEGVPTESFIDYVGRQGFDNYSEFLAQGLEERVITEKGLPRVAARRILPPALRVRLGLDDAA